MRKSIFIGPIATVTALFVAFLTLGTLGGAPSAAAKGSSGNRFNIPNVPLVTHEGKTVMFYDDLIKDKKVLINFMYKTCEATCPLSTAKLAQIQRRLGDRIGRSIFIYSITLEPENDTPEVLKKYAEQYGAGPGWFFLTGTRENIDAVRFKLGERTEDLESHNNIIRLGTGKSWMRLTMFGDIDYLVNEIGKTLDKNWYARTGKKAKSYAEAPRLASKSLGHLMFRNRCSACHTIGRGKHIGPDLKDVTTRRDRTWLRNYIYNPQSMRARKDPIALELFEEWDEIPMPNLELATYEVLDLIDYLDTESRRLDKLEKAKHEGHQMGKHEGHQKGKHGEKHGKLHDGKHEGHQGHDG